MEEELKPLLFRGQSAEWVVLKPPTKDEIRDSWVVKFIFEPDFEHARMWTEIVCGGPRCENILEAGSRGGLLARFARKKIVARRIRGMRLEHFYCYNSGMRRFPELDIKEFKIFAKLDSPHKVQDFLDKLPINFDDVFRSPLMTLFRRGKYWGAVSKTNHSVLRYRDPVYRDIRELAMSFFNEYFLEDGRKTLRAYSRPFDLLRYGDDWLTTGKDMSYMEKDLDRSPHIRLIPNGSARVLRPAHPLEIKASNFTEWRSKIKRRSV